MPLGIRLLHHPGYRTRFANNLKRELPRIPLAPDFWAFADAGRKLAELHVGYESVEPWPLEYWTNMSSDDNVELSRSHSWRIWLPPMLEPMCFTPE